MAHEGGGGSTILLLGAAGVAIYGYFQNWFASFGFASTAAAATPAAPASTTPAASTASVPALGSVVHSAADVAAQVAAKDPYILPDNSVISQAPVGYVLAANSTPAETGTTNGQFYLRSDVADAVVALINAVNTAAGRGASASLLTLYNFPIANLAQLKTIMSSKGLTGLGDYQRHMYTRTGRYRPVRVA
jgi:hypothetical protein